MSFVFARAVIDFLFSLAFKLLAFLSKSVPSSSSWFVCVIIECKIQNTGVMDITDTTYSLLLISEELMQQDSADHLERLVLSPIHHLIIFANVLTQQPTEQFCLYCSNTFGGHHTCTRTCTRTRTRTHAHTQSYIANTYSHINVTIWAPYMLTYIPQYIVMYYHNVLFYIISNIQKMI